MNKSPYSTRVWLATLVLAGAITSHSVEVRTLGGGPTQGNPGRAGYANGNTLAAAKFNQPFDVAISPSGDLLIADRNNKKLREIIFPGDDEISTTTTFALRLPNPVGVEINADGDVYTVNQRDGSVRRYSSTGQLLDTVRGFASPTAIAVDSTGNVYVSELRGSIYLLSPDGAVQEIASGFARPRGLAMLNDDLLAISESGGHAIYTLKLADGSVTLLSGNNGPGFKDGDASVAQFNSPYGIAAAPNGMLVVADRLNHRVRLVDTRGTNGFVQTLYGLPRTQWSRPYAGWRDGDDLVAVGREPVGVAVATNGNVYVTERYWNIIREVRGTGLAGGTGTNNPGTTPGATNAPVTGANVLSFGFSTGEGSSDFVGAAGQRFYAPVTLMVPPGQKIYSLQLGLSATNDGATALAPDASRFLSLLVQPSTTANEYVGLRHNYEFVDSGANLHAVGWIERYLKTNLYNTLVHDLIKYSLPKDRLFLSDNGQVVLGAYGLAIPSNATVADSYRIAISRASATPQNWTEDLPLDLPTNGSLGSGAINAVKRITLGSRPYIVGDTVPFRWFNAGDFGEGYLLNNDVIQVFESAVYRENYPIHDSDLFDAMDSSSGSTNTLFSGDDGVINTITTGDGVLGVDDVFVTFRRSLDPTLKWFARYWSNGVRQVVEVPNVAKPGGDPFFPPPPLDPIAGRAKTFARPRVAVAMNDITALAGSVIQLPIHVQVTDYPIRVMMLNVDVEALDGSPVLTESIQLQTAPTFQGPELMDSKGPFNFAAAWLNRGISGVSGNSVLGILTIRVPSGAGPRAAYRIRFKHFSCSPNGLALFETHVSNALVLLSDRSASTWNDGISDEWRLRYFGSISAPESDPNADPDGDGAVNSVENDNGTDPTDPRSF